MEAGTNIITLVSSDGEKIEISSKAAEKSNLVKGILEDYPDDVVVPLHKFKSNILKKIKEFLEHYENEEPVPIEKPLVSQNFHESVSEWDYNYINVDLDLTFELISAANYMHIPHLFDLASAKVASIIKNRNQSQIKKTFNIPQEFTQEEEKKIFEDNKWCLENL